MLREIVAEHLTADPFHRFADPIDIDTVIPFFAGVEDEREGMYRPISAFQIS
jgi:hypothetical protein